VNTLRLLPLALPLAFLCSCSKPPAPPRENFPVGSGEVSTATMELWSVDQPGDAVFRAMLAALDGATNRDEILARYAVRADAAIVESLTLESPTELKRKLATLERGTARHHYTRYQLEAALKLKAAEKAEREANRRSP
jgi:hypothetical protein